MKNLNVTFTTIFLALACFGLLPQMQAVVPPPDGCYPGFTTAEGCNALNFLTTGAGNTGVGWYSLFLNSAANYNTGVGAGTLVLNDSDSNTAVGTAAMLLNTSGTANVAVGTNALLYNDSGNFNTAVGYQALFSNTTGTENTALGEGTLSSNTDGDFNTATGDVALLNNTTGINNTANGHSTLVHNIEGSFNVAVGDGALFDNTSGSDNTALGGSAGSNQTTGSGNVYVGDGMFGVAGESNHTYIRNIKDTIVSGGGTDFVSVNLTTGLLGHVSSSRRYKEQIEPMDKASEALYRLKPVTYRFKKGIDPTQGLEYGLVAEDVAQVNPNLAIRDGKGQIESVRYMAINVMLLNEFLKEHATVQELKKEIAALNTSLKEQAAQIQKVTAKVDIAQPASQVIATTQ